MRLPTEPYSEQARHWPTHGRHILAHHDDESIIVYQAYRPSIARYAMEHGCFGGPDFSYGRLSWIKPNFLWMMYRCGWGTKEGQEMTLALRLRRSFFDAVLAQTVPTAFRASHFPSEEAWRDALTRADVQLQWDPDHDPTGQKLERRAIQLGMRRAVLEAYGHREILEVIDMSDFVAEQRANAHTSSFSALRTPTERVYRPRELVIAERVRLDDWGASQHVAS